MVLSTALISSSLPFDRKLIFSFARGAISKQSAKRQYAFAFSGSNFKLRIPVS
jgi:hypothetical protein